MFRTTGSMVRATLVSTFLSKLTFSCQDDYCPCRLELESKRTKIILTAWQHVQDTVTMLGTTFAKHLSLQIDIFLSRWPLSLKSGVQEDKDHPDSMATCSGQLSQCSEQLLPSTCLSKLIFSCQDDHCPWSLELESKEDKDHPDSMATCSGQLSQC